MFSVILFVRHAFRYLAFSTALCGVVMYGGY